MARAGKSAPVPPHLEPAEASSLTIPSLPAHLHRSWGQALEPLTRDSGWPRLMHFLAEERAQGEVFPAEADVFSAFLFTPLDRVKVVILGQDPYPTPGAAHGLCFSVLPGIKLPASLRNIYRELQDDVGVKPVGHGCLRAWAERGVLLLNACLTVRSGQPNSHAGQGWESFTDAAIRAVSELPRPVVFLLWGAFAHKKERLIDVSRHAVIKATHPSPLSARGGFFGSKPFSRANAALIAANQQPIDWQLPNEPR
jgi:uracil-DNA glycosylase